MPKLISVGLVFILVLASSLLLETASATAPSPANTWGNVTPANANLSSSLDCGNYGAYTIVVDPQRASDLYTHFDCQGVWKSTDYGQTWTGPINTGTNGATAGDGAGGISIATQGAGNPPALMLASIRGPGTGFWKSTDGGVSWTNYQITPPNPWSGGQDVYWPDVDPYDPSHLLLNVHEANGIRESFDGGQTWHAVNEDPGMCSAKTCPPLNFTGVVSGQSFIGTSFTKFIDTGVASTTRTTWLTIAEKDSGSIGTWRTTNAGASWTQINNYGHIHGNFQLYQSPLHDGILVMGATNGVTGAGGVLRTTDYGQTWSNVGVGTPQLGIAFGTSDLIWADQAGACGLLPACNQDPQFQTAAYPGTSGWATVPQPTGLNFGAGAGASTFDGTEYVMVTANWGAGIWRYVESPSAGSTSTATPTPLGVSSSTPTPVGVSTSTPSPTSTPRGRAPTSTATATVVGQATATPTPTEMPTSTRVAPPRRP
jgi:hypothetical protein